MHLLAIDLFKSAVFFFIFISILIIHVENDYDKIQKGKTINHTKSATIRLCIFSIYFLLVQNSITLTISNVVHYSLQYWLYFDLFLNLKRGLSINYIGKKAIFDRFLAFISVGNIVLFKISIILLYGILEYYISKRYQIIDSYLIEKLNFIFG